MSDPAYKGFDMKVKNYMTYEVNIGLKRSNSSQM